MVLPPFSRETVVSPFENKITGSFPRMQGFLRVFGKKFLSWEKKGEGEGRGRQIQERVNCILHTEDISKNFR